MDVRTPNVAGAFYPADRQELLSEINRCFRSVPSRKGAKEKVRALISPHAGYLYSGITAAAGYALLQGQEYDAVLVLGPSHYAVFPFAALDDCRAWQTPLGLVRLHQELIQKLSASGALKEESRVFAHEHSIEVQLPFLQRVVKEFSLVPICCGQNLDHRKVAEALHGIISERALVVVSSDLSHYLPLRTAQKRDRETIAAIVSQDGERMKANLEACGSEGIMVLDELARLERWKAREVDSSTSAEASGDASAVVGYASIVYVGA